MRAAVHNDDDIDEDVDGVDVVDGCLCRRFITWSTILVSTIDAVTTEALSP